MPKLSIILTTLGALIFNFVTGFHDAANAIATSVLTRALAVRSAIIMAAGLNLLGALINESVAHTIGKGIIQGDYVTEQVVLAALVGAIAWNLVTWRLGLPSSSSHAIIGGLVGAAGAAGSQLTAQNGMVSWGFNYAMFNQAGLLKVFLALLISPIAGFIVAWLFIILLYHIFARTAPRVLNAYFRKIQVVSAGFMAFSHGSNDAQNAMGIITMALVSAGYLGSFVVPVWVKIICAVAMGLGTAAGGWRIIKTVGRKVMELLPVHGFAAETSAAAVIQACTHIGAPISTTHVISSSIMGVGVSRRISAVRWKVVGNILLAWFLTMPMSALIAFFAYEIIIKMNL